MVLLQGVSEGKGLLMPTLKEINAEFMTDAHLTRYSYLSSDGREHWTNDPPKSHNEMNGSVFRSIRYFSDNFYMCVMDVDGPQFCEQTVEATSALRLTFRNTLKVSPLLKASGKKGAQIICDMTFPKNWTEKRCLQGLAQTAFTVWKRSPVEAKLGIKFGLKLPGIYVDACMFRKGRMLRGFCKHLGSGMYSVPFLPTDTYKTVRKRMTLELEPLPFTIPVLWYPDIADGLLPYDDKYFLETQGPSEAVFERLDAMKTRAGRHDFMYENLTPRLKKVVDFDGDIHHDLKWMLVCYLYCRERMERDDITQWLWDNAQWDDLDDLGITAYQVNYTCDWCDELLKVGRSPLKTKRLEWIWEVS